MKEYRLNKGLPKQDPKQIIIHAMGEYLKTPLKSYWAPEYLEFLGLSVHRFITPSGLLIKAREDWEGAYHARGWNVDTLGIEFLVPKAYTYERFLEKIKTDWVSEEQYITGAKQCRQWMQQFGIVSIFRHRDISPERKVDPGEGFRWGYFLNLIQDGLGEAFYD